MDSQDPLYLDASGDVLSELYSAALSFLFNALQNPVFPIELRVRIALAVLSHSRSAHATKRHKVSHVSPHDNLPKC